MVTPNGARMILFKTEIIISSSASEAQLTGQLQQHMHVDLKTDRSLLSAAYCLPQPAVLLQNMADIDIEHKCMTYPSVSFSFPSWAAG